MKNTIPTIAVVLALAGLGALTSSAYAGTTDVPELCRAEQLTLQQDGAKGVSPHKYETDKAGLNACLTQRQMDNTTGRKASPVLRLSPSGTGVHG